MKILLVAASAFGFLGVAFGAFGAHYLKERLKIPQNFLDAYHTGVLYHLLHVFAIIACYILEKYNPSTRLFSISGYFFIAGIILFSGSLYAMGFTQIRKLGAITPIGGLMFLAGWALMLIQSIKWLKP